MKRLMMTLAMLGFITAFAQEGPRPEKKHMSPEERTEKILNKMSAEVQLDAKQRNAMHDVILQREMKREEKKNEMQGVRKAHHEEMKRLNENSEAEIKKILSDEQYQKLQTYREREKEQWKKEGRKSHPHHKAAPATPEKPRN